MMLKAQIFQDKALLLDSCGRVWQFKIGFDDQPEIQMLEKVSSETTKRLMEPDLARYVPQP